MGCAVKDVGDLDGITGDGVGAANSPVVKHAHINEDWYKHEEISALYIHEFEAVLSSY